MKYKSITKQEKVWIGGIDLFILILCIIINTLLYCFCMAIQDIQRFQLLEDFNLRLMEYVLFLTGITEDPCKPCSNSISINSINKEQFISDTVQLVNILCLRDLARIILERMQEARY